VIRIDLNLRLVIRFPIRPLFESMDRRPGLLLPEEVDQSINQQPQVQRTSGATATISSQVQNVIARLLNYP